MQCQTNTTFNPSKKSKLNESCLSCDRNGFLSKDKIQYSSSATNLIDKLQNDQYHIYQMNHNCTNSLKCLEEYLKYLSNEHINMIEGISAHVDKTLKTQDLQHLKIKRLEKQVTELKSQLQAFSQERELFPSNL